jgi:lipoprotein-anchoring transpeptidase ErfK/SrfK
MSPRRAAGPRAALAAALLLVVALVAVGCGADTEPRAQTQTTTAPRTLSTTPQAGDAPAEKPAAAPRLRGPLAFHVTRRAQLRRAPGGRGVATIKTRTEFKSLTLFHRGKMTDRYRVAIGTDATPTPTGRFAVTDRLKTADENGDYGCCILALNGHQTKIAQGWGGGDRIAIHATPHTWTIGKQVSHGCVRATNKALHQLMRKVRLGTPVRIKT